MNERTMTEERKCPACGVAYVEHLGLIGTCKELQELKALKSRIEQFARDWTVVAESLDYDQDCGDDDFLNSIYELNQILDPAVDNTGD